SPARVLYEIIIGLRQFFFKNSDSRYKCQKYVKKTPKRE
ncbi:hypothetical protein Pgy4_35488, partial [Pseudomonas savastanoi pv. glycinea str. race 4]